MRKKRHLATWATLVALTAASAAYAHSWYPYDCCSDADCWPMGQDSDAKEPDPKIVPGGYRTYDGIFVPENQTRPSRDGRFHVCRYGGRKDAAVITSPKGLCLFVPQPTF